MPTRLVHLVVDANDPAALARFWASALGWVIADETAEEVDIWPAGYQYPDPSAVPLVFVPVPEPKTAKDRVHLDLATTSAVHQAELVSRLQDLGAAPADIGQGDVPWAVLADPEGNEFCVLEPRDIYLDTGPVAAILTDCCRSRGPGPVLGGRGGLAGHIRRGPYRGAPVPRGHRALPGIPAGARPEAGQEPDPPGRSSLSR